MLEDPEDMEPVIPEEPIHIIFLRMLKIDAGRIQWILSCPLQMKACITKKKIYRKN
jgi:hypothetical protein